MMRNHRGKGYSSRYERRKSKTDRILNWSIGIVSLLILAVGCIILISVFNTSADRPAAKPAGQSENQGVSLSENQAGSSSESSSTDGSSAADSSAESDESGQVPNDESASSASGESSSSSSSAGSGESHQASYEIGSADWNAQVAAISAATGIESGNMTIHWLGNGGSPNSSLARVSPKNEQGSIYVVHLVYQDGKWQADDLKKPGE
ncbi:YrrS family protein [Sporolactobacillus sp. THM19-2]|uniref:YrrS family protein n=1 Tax=Sporolactobacillus sp. THM19-2 TaxID=2511171 RepID=UPI001F0EEF40|nr:YrrS family protein [Sporolactobacillus sp. THM19-2]